MAEKQISGLASVREFYRGRDVLVTGGTGFLGKVLVEKLLRACPDIGTLYLVVRAKRGRTAHQRLQQLLDLDVYNRLREEDPAAFNKVVAVEGDLDSEELILDKRFRSTIENDVSVIFHSAATVKFDEKIKQSVNTNVRGTKHIIDLAKNMRQLNAMVYISTAYSNCDRTFIGDEYYPVHAPRYFWSDLITAVNKMNDNELNALSSRLIGKLPNNYTFTKQVTESLVHDFKDQIPLVIYRPSIVIGAFFEPYSGWVDNLNGAIGVMALQYTGVMRTLLADPAARQDYVGVDFAVNGAIAAAWRRAHMSRGICPVYNCALGERAPTFADLTRLTKMGKECPAQKTVWKPKMGMTTNMLWFTINFVLFTVLPAAILDVALRLKGIKFNAVRACRKIISVCRVLKYFSTTNLIIENKNIIELYDTMSVQDKELFNFDVNTVPTMLEELSKVNLLGIKKYILKEDISESSIDKFKNRVKYYDWADMAMNLLFSMIMVKFVWSLVSSITNNKSTL